MAQKIPAEAVHESAVRLFESGIAHDALIQKLGKIGPAIAIVSPDGELDSWFVAITVGEKLAGFLQLDRSLRLLRYSTYQRRPGSVDDCPLASTWLDITAISERARTKADPHDRLSTPVLSYDANPSRIAWLVKATAPDRRPKTIFIAGEFAYIGRAADTDETST